VSAVDREVVELLRDDPDLLAIADAIVATQPASGRRRGRSRLLVAAAVVIVAVVLAVVAPWGGHGNGLVERALAAVGRGPVLHAVIESTVPNGTIVDLSTGAERPVPQRLEYWYDADRQLLRAVTSVNGGVVADALVPPRSAQLDPALTAFLGRYRAALKSGQAHEAGRGTFHGRSVIWLRFDYRLFGERVGIDSHTYRPVVIQPLDANGAPARQSWQVTAIGSGPYRARELTPAHPAPAHTSMRGANFRLIVPTRAARVLGWTPLWLGESFRGLPLRYAQLQDLIHEQPASPATHGIMLAYGRGANRIQLTEARTVEGTFWLLGLGMPEPGTTIVLRGVVSGSGPIKRTCQALVRAGGAWVNVEGWNQASSLCVAAARGLVRIEP
jgi:hypothetical protein